LIYKQILLPQNTYVDVGILLNNVTYDDSIVNIMDIGTGSAGLACRTTYRPCCSAANPEAQWYFPNGCFSSSVSCKFKLKLQNGTGEF